MKHDGQVIFQHRDEFGLIEVVENATTRKLFFDSAVEQSCLYINAPMQLNFEYQEKIIERLLHHHEQVKAQQTYRVLMLGMGGGSIVHQLFHLHLDMQMSVVELRQAVIDCAYDYFQLPDEPEIEVIHADALQFIAENDYPYDAIIVDIFDADGVAAGLSESSFQQNLWHNLKPHGLLLFNLWFAWNKKSSSGKPLPTAESQTVLDYWQKYCRANGLTHLNRYNIRSSQNLILEVCKAAPRN